jgi:hypothetical protein
MSNALKTAATFDTGGDDFDSIPVKTTTPTTAVPVVAAPAQPVSPTVTFTDDDDISFDDEKIGEAVKVTNDLPMIKISKLETARFAFVPNFKIKRARVHYLDGKGSIVCNSTKDKQEVCCAKSDKGATDKFTALVYRYTNVDPKSGKFLAGVTVPVVEIQAVRMSRSNMRDILDSVEEGQSVYDIDVRMRHDDSRAFGCKFSKASSKNAWRAIEADALALSEPFKDGVKLSSRLGKRLNAVELNAAFSSKNAMAEPSLADLADLD